MKASRIILLVLFIGLILLNPLRHMVRSPEVINAYNQKNLQEIKAVEGEEDS